jgi:hypothetical protein
MDHALVAGGFFALVLNLVLSLVLWMPDSTLTLAHVLPVGFMLLGVGGMVWGIFSRPETQLEE